MPKSSLELFVERLNGFASWPQSRQVDYVAYFLSLQEGFTSFTAKQIEDCFDLLSIRPYRRLAVYLSEGTAKKDGKYLKSENGYRLERATHDEIRAAVDAEPPRAQVSKQLSDLVLQIKDTQERAFLEEAIRCYRVEAYRATIVMVWVLTIDHLQKHVFGQRLADFNSAIVAHSDKKLVQVVNYDDFSNIKESRLIELMRSVNIISNDVRKILDEKLGIRNSAGHPSGIQFSGHKTTEFVLDLINNILLKY
jgi:hypothetical protein